MEVFLQALMDSLSFFELLRTLRYHRRMALGQVATALSMSPSQLSLIEHGLRKPKEPKAFIEKLVALFDLPEQYSQLLASKFLEAQPRAEKEKLLMWSMQAGG
jgi:transcriptional regulator with XRE-family HTH domain